MKNFYNVSVLFTFIFYEFISLSFAIHNEYMTFYTPVRSGKRYIYLEGKYSYSVQLILHKGDEKSDNVTRGSSSEFIVKGPQYSYYGIMAIIQSLHLRTNSTDPEKCSDFMQFLPDSKVKGDRTEKICGTLLRDSSGSSFEPPGLIGQRTFFNPNGSIRLQVHVSKEHIDRNIGAEIVFTAYTNEFDFTNEGCPGSDVGLKTLNPCSPVEYLGCIPTPLFCDSKIDCGFESDFAIDEQHCYFPYLYGLIAVIIIILVVLTIYAFMHWVRIKAKRTAESVGITGNEKVPQDECADVSSPEVALGDFSCSF